MRRAADGKRAFVLDLSGLDYMSSRGLRALTLGKREAGDAVAITLAAPNERIREILAISRYDRLFFTSRGRFRRGDAGLRGQVRCWFGSGARAGRCPWRNARR